MVTTQTLDELIRRYAQELAEYGIDQPLREVRLLMEAANGIEIKEQLVAPDKTLNQAQVNSFQKYLRARKNRTPYAYLTNVKEFYGREFYIKNCLIPRPETELIVDFIKENIQERFEGKCNILDLCTGSGCLGLTVLLELEKQMAIELTMTDISDQALDTCKVNVKKHCSHNSKIMILKSDLFPNRDFENPQFFDLIVANPPYIKSGDITGLAPEVAGYEPHLALDGGVEGLDFYFRIAEEIRPFLQKKQSTVLLMEHGAGQRKAIIKIFEETDLVIKERIELNDWQGHDRVLGFVLTR